MSVYDAATAVICLGLPYLFYRLQARKAAQSRAIQQRLDRVIGGY